MNRAGLLRFWSTIASQFLRRAGIFAIMAFVAQFYLFFWAGFALRISVVRLSPSFTLLRWVADLTLLATQLLLGYGIARYGKTRALGICAIVVVTDCVIGALHVRKGNINMAAWSIPLLVSTFVGRRAGVGRRERLPHIPT